MTDAEYAQAYRVFQTKMENKYTRIVARALNEGVKGFFEYAQQHGIQVALNMMHVSLGFEPLAKAMLRLYKESGMRWGMFVYRDINTQKRLYFDRINSQLLKFIEQFFQDQFMNRAILPILENVRIWLRDEIVQRLAEGQAFDFMARRLTAPDVQLTRARRIVRTETVRASNESGDAAAKRTGLTLQKGWISAQDSRTRRLPRDGADHLHMNGITVGMDETFPCPTKKHGVVQMKQPGDSSAPAVCVINCRCTARYKPQRDARGRLIRR